MLNAREEDRHVIDLSEAPRKGNASRGHVKHSKHVCAGSCHCGNVQFQAVVDTSTSTRKCNCSYCTRTRFWKVFVGMGDFLLISGNEALSEYRFGNDMAGHFFCKYCGTNVFMRIDLDDTGEHGHVINMDCLDDASRKVIAEMPVVFEDGRNDNWWVEPAVKRHLW